MIFWRRPEDALISLTILTASGETHWEDRDK